MRYLIMADIHGNAAALEAVTREPHDAAICLGDTVGYGPDPGDSMRWVCAHAALTLQGNHDRALGEGVAPQCRPAFEWLATAMAPLGRKQLSQAERRHLADLPRAAKRHLDGLRCLLVHATPSNPLYRYLGPDREGWTREVADLAVDLILVGHTHLQFDLECNGRRVVNPGSVGQPKDGDPRAAYALLEDGCVLLRRAEYDVERTVLSLERSGASRAAVAALTLLLRTGRGPGSEPT